MNRRGFLKGLAATGIIAAAPAIAREGILMPVKQVIVPEYNWGLGTSQDPVHISEQQRLNRWFKQMHEVLKEQCVTMHAEFDQHYLNLKEGVPKHPEARMHSAVDAEILQGRRLMNEAPIHSSRPAGHSNHYLDTMQYAMQGWEKQEAVKKYYEDVSLYGSGTISINMREAKTFAKVSKFFKQFDK